jgi:hypothetical protein
MLSASRSAQAISEPVMGVVSMKASRSVFAVTTFLLLSACATSNRVDQTFSPSRAPKTIFISERQSEYEARHINQVIRTFEKYGYDVAKEKAQATYYLDFSISGGLVITVDISLLRTQDSVRVLTVSSTNTGWGTVIARPIAISGRVAEALSELDEILARSR